MTKAIEVVSMKVPTKEEIEIVQMIADDYSPEDIATEKHVSIRDIYELVLGIKKEYRVKHHAALVSLFFRNKLIK